MSKDAEQLERLDARIKKLEEKIEKLKQQRASLTHTTISDSIDDEDIRILHDIATCGILEQKRSTGQWTGQFHDVTSYFANGLIQRYNILGYVDVNINPPPGKNRAWLTIKGEAAIQKAGKAVYLNELRPHVETIDPEDATILIAITDAGSAEHHPDGVINCWKCAKGTNERYYFFLNDPIQRLIKTGYLAKFAPGEAGNESEFEIVRATAKTQTELERKLTSK